MASTRLLVIFTLLFGLTPLAWSQPPVTKVAFLTATVSQSEDEFRSVEMLAKRYPGQIVHQTYPDNFMQEQETVISNILSLVSDPQVKGVVVTQGIPGTVAAFKRVKRVRPDVWLLSFEAHEDGQQVGAVADLVLNNDNVNRGKTIPQGAKKMGAKKLLHYSFPRHMSYKILADRRDLMKAEAEKLGMEFIFITAPDPLGEGGLPAAQQFMLEDVPRQVATHGKDIAFFCTNDAMTEPMIKRVAEQKAIFVEPDVPSPTMGYPGAFGIKIPPEKAGDFQFINEQNRLAVAAAGNTGRMGTWPVPLPIIASKVLARLVLENHGDKAKLKDKDLIRRYLKEESGVEAQLTPYMGIESFQLVLLDRIVY
jgi:hypothetical protein